MKRFIAGIISVSASEIGGVAVEVNAAPPPSQMIINNGARMVINNGAQIIIQ